MDLQSIGRCPDEGLDLEVLLQEFEERLSTHNENVIVAPSVKQLVIHIGAIEREDGFFGKVQLARDFEIMQLAYGDPGEDRQMAVVIEEQMEFDRAFGLAKSNPQSKTEPHRSMTEGSILKSLFLKRNLRTAGATFLACLSTSKKSRGPLIHLLGTLLVRRSQCGTLGGMENAEMAQFSQARGETSTDISQRVGLTELAEEHGYQLIPARKGLRVVVAMTLVNDPIKIGPRKKG